jgi:hypothetical protein
VVARVCVVAVALAVLAWLAVLERDTRLLASGVAALEPGAGADALARGESDLRAARLLNPDTAPDYYRALVLRARGDADGAQAAIEDVLRREPDNLRAWATLALLANERDEAAVRRAHAARLRLDPLNARAAR